MKTLFHYSIIALLFALYAPDGACDYLHIRGGDVIAQSDDCAAIEQHFVPGDIIAEYEPGEDPKKKYLVHTVITRTVKRTVPMTWEFGSEGIVTIYNSRESAMEKFNRVQSTPNLAIVPVTQKHHQAARNSVIDPQTIFVPIFPSELDIEKLKND